MFKRLMFLGILAATLGFAQEEMGGMGGMGGGSRNRGGGNNNMMGDMGSGMPRMQRQSREEQIADKLKLNKEQKEQFAAILSAAREQAGSLRESLLKERIALAQALANQSDDLRDKARMELAMGIAKMDTIEADAFRKIYTMLKPNQQSKAAQTFELMAGMFESPGRQGGARTRGEGKQ